MDDALFVGQSMPWIDPLKEALAWQNLVQDGFASEVEVMRKRGANPRDVLEQIKAHRDKAKEKGLVFSSDFANQRAPKAPSPIDNKD
jgi:capsid protein